MGLHKDLQDAVSDTTMMTKELLPVPKKRMAANPTLPYNTLILSIPLFALINRIS
jgi:hypothetical protein